LDDLFLGGGGIDSGKLLPVHQTAGLFSAGFAGYGQLGSAFCTTAGQHFASVGGLHAFAKSMDCFATACVWLKSAFHCIFFCSYSLIIKEFTSVFPPKKLNRCSKGRQS
jgi:hypothetical protein